MTQPLAIRGQANPVALLDVDARGTFIGRTYAHLLGAVVAFVGIEWMLFSSGIAQPMAQAMLGGSWLLVLGGFMLVSWLARHFAGTAETLPTQYLGLSLYVVAQAILFIPLLFVANMYAPGTIASAGMVTLLGFTGLSGTVFFTRKDFSFLGGLLRWGGLCALLAIVAATVFGFSLGTFFSVAMVGFAGAAILYDTSNVLHHYPEERYVAASLALFASVALLFWYVLRLFMGSRR